MLKSKHTDMLQILLIYHDALLLRSLNYSSFDRTSLSEQHFLRGFPYNSGCVPYAGKTS